MSPVTKWVLIAVLAAVASAYFAIMVWGAGPLARILLRKGYAERGFDEPGLAVRLRVLGWVGLAVSLAGVVVAVARARG